MKKLLSLILAVLLLISALPLSISSLALQSGSFGDGLFWELDEEPGILTISGTGEMPDYNYSGNRPPWYSYRNQVLSAVIEEGITSIGKCAFYSFYYLDAVSIPSSIESIADTAFTNCSDLSRVDITDLSAWCKISFDSGANPLSSAGNLYLNGSAITALTIPSDVTSIGSYAFSGFKGMTSLTVSSEVESISETAFMNCSKLIKISVDSGNSTFSASGNCLINDQTKTLVLGCKNSRIPTNKGLTAIGDYAFYGCSELASVTLPNTLKTIGACAFSGCSKLIYVSLSNGKLESIGISAFSGCKMLLFPIPATVKSIGHSAFHGCFSLTNITIPEGITSIEANTFSSCDKLKSITLPDSLTSIGNGAFQACYALTNITIPQNVTSIGDSAFEGCSALTSLIIPEKTTSIGWWAFQGCSALTSMSVPEGVTVIEPYTFANCSSLAAVSLPAGITKFRRYAFSNCTSLTTINIPSEITSIEEYAFSNCSALESLTLPPSDLDISYHAFSSCGKLTLTVIENTSAHQYAEINGIPYILLSCEHTNTRAYNAYPPTCTEYGYSGDICCSDCLTYLYQGETISPTGHNIENGICSRCGLATCGDNLEWVYDSELKTLNILGTGSMYSYASASQTPWYSHRNEINQVVIDYGVTSIGINAFSYCSAIKAFIIPSSVTTIGSGSFYGCESLTELSLPSSITSIGSSAFEGCPNINLTVELISTAYTYAVDNKIPYTLESPIASLKVTHMPNKTVYPLGAQLNTGGLVITAITENGKSYNVTDFCSLEWDLSSPGIQTVSAIFENASTSFEVTVDENLVEYPESDHPYANNTDLTWHYTHKTEVTSLNITFSADTETEKNYDKIYIYNALGEELGCYSGTELAGKTITILGSSFSIRLTSDYSLTKNGFTIVSITSADVTTDNTQGGSKVVLGDATGDGEINIKDLIRLKKLISEGADGDKATDTDENGELNSLDLVYIRKYILELI